MVNRRVNMDASDSRWPSVRIDGAERLLGLLVQGAGHASVRQKKGIIVEALRAYISKTPQATQPGPGVSPAVVPPALALATLPSPPAAE